MIATDGAVAVVCLVGFWLPNNGLPTWFNPIHIAMMAVVAAGLLLHRRWPIPALVVVAAATVAGLVQSFTLDPFIAAAWILHTVSTTRRSARVSVTGPVTIGVLVVVFALLGGTNSWETVRYILLSLVITAGAWALGSAMVRERAESAHAMRAERDNALSEERLRIAREIHDVVSHALGTIAVTSSVGAHLGSGGPERLQAIAGISSRALSELGSALTVVREPTAAAERRPQPGLDDLAELVGNAANTELAMELAGTPDITAGLALAVYRIVQEGLTNVARHAPGAQCTVTVTGTAAQVLVQVENERPELEPALTGGSGTGLAGLRERVELWGGSFRAGPRPGGGFAIHAALPLTPR